MLSELPCRPLRVVATPVPLQIVWPLTDKRFFSPLHGALYMLTRFWKAGLAYQFVIEAVPASNQFSLDRNHNASQQVANCV
jgi:hypothetical protein